MAEILDLDALSPKPKKVKLSGKIIDVYPPTVKQLLHITAVGKEISDTSDPEKAMQSVIDALSPIIPAFKDDPDIDFTVAQLTALVDFIQEMSSPSDLKAVKSHPSEKKISSPKA
jgi:hypothetical protein